MSKQSNPQKTFNRSEMEEIRDRLGRPRARIDCPRCGVALVFTGPVAGAGTTRRYYEIECGHCQLKAMTIEMPGADRLTNKDS